MGMGKGKYLWVYVHGEGKGKEAVGGWLVKIVWCCISGIASYIFLAGNSTRTHIMDLSLYLSPVDGATT